MLLRSFRAVSRLQAAAKSSNPFADAIHNGSDLGTGANLPYETGEYASAFRESVERPEEFWGRQAERLEWHAAPSRVLDAADPARPRWFVGGQLSTCHNALDRHVAAGLGSHVALVHDSPITASQAHLTYHDLLRKVQALAGALRSLGVERGHRVLIYMPMIPETLVGMLATNRLGAAHCIVFGGFAAKELAVRINHARPTVVLSASGGLEPGRTVAYKPILDDALRLSTWKPKHCVVYQRPGLDVRAELTPQRDLEWETAAAEAPPVLDCVPVDSQDPVYIIHTSGTTGVPKGIVRPSGGHAVVMPWSMQAIYGVKPGETWWAASDLGWVVGHSYICYAPLMYGARSVLYEGKPVGTPDEAQFFRVIADHDVVSCFFAPTALRAIHQRDPLGAAAEAHPMKSFRILFSAGEKLDMDTRRWAERVFKVPVLDHWWQSESGWPICCPSVGLGGADLAPARDVSGKPTCGWDVRAVKEDGEAAGPGELGRIVVKLPLPPGSFSTLLDNDERFHKTYFEAYPGFYDTMDAGRVEADGSVSVMSRVDDVINVAGHRISGFALEEAVLDHWAVVDVAVVGAEDSVKGVVPVAFVVVREDWDGEEADLALEVVRHVRSEVGAVAALKTVLRVPKLPKTRSGKIPRNTLAALLNAQPLNVPVTIDDPTVYPIIVDVLKSQNLYRPPKDS